MAAGGMSWGSRGLSPCMSTSADPLCPVLEHRSNSTERGHGAAHAVARRDCNLEAEEETLPRRTKWAGVDELEPRYARVDVPTQGPASTGKEHRWTSG